jgi:hypothetical protein
MEKVVDQEMLEHEASLTTEELYDRAKESFHSTYYTQEERMRRNQVAIERYEVKGRDWITSIDYNFLKRWQEELGKIKTDHSRMIRIDGVPNDTLLSDIGELFGQCGKIEEIVFSRKARFVAENGKGSVTVTFSSSAEALKAILFNGSEYTTTLNKNGWRVCASNKPEVFSTESKSKCKACDGWGCSQCPDVLSPKIVAKLMSEGIAQENSAVKSKNSDTSNQHRLALDYMEVCIVGPEAKNDETPFKAELK